MCKFLFIITITILSHLQERDSICLSLFYRSGNHFDKVSICAVPVEVIKSVTAAKYKGSPIFIPLHGTAARQISVRHLYASVLSNLRVVEGSSSLFPRRLDVILVTIRA